MFFFLWTYKTNVDITKVCWRCWSYTHKANSRFSPLPHPLQIQLRPLSAHPPHLQWTAYISLSSAPSFYSWLYPRPQMRQALTANPQATLARQSDRLSSYLPYISPSLTPSVMTSSVPNLLLCLSLLSAFIHRELNRSQWNTLIFFLSSRRPQHCPQATILIPQWSSQYPESHFTWTPRFLKNFLTKQHAQWEPILKREW